MINNYTKIYFILLLILTSGTVYFSLLHGKIFVALLFLSSIALLYNRKRIDKYNLKVLSIFMTFLLINVLFNINNGVSYGTIGGLILKVCSVSIIISEISLKDFKKYFVNIMSVLCVMSLFNFFLSVIFPNLKFPFVFHEIIAGNWFTYAPYHTWGWETAFNRNAGMFWEPGAFQAFLSLAILMLIDDKKNDIFNINKKIKMLILFIITILSTKSTTGYIILLMLIVYTIINNIELLKKRILPLLRNLNRKNIIILSISLLILLIATGFILNNGVITKKFKSNNPSYSIRSEDFTNSLKIIASRPLVGYGYMSKSTIMQEVKYNIKDNSNGLLFVSYMFGLPIAITLIFLYYKGLKNLLPNINPFYSLLVFIIIFMTEYLILMPIYLAITFRLNSGNFINVKFKKFNEI